MHVSRLVYGIITTARYHKVILVIHQQPIHLALQGTLLAVEIQGMGNGFVEVTVHFATRGDIVQAVDLVQDGSGKGLWLGHVTSFRGYALMVSSCGGGGNGIQWVGS